LRLVEGARSLVGDRHRPLPAETYPSQARLMAQTLLVRRFQEARSQTSVDLDARSDDLL